MTQITVTLNKDTPFEHLNEVASFILHMAALVHGKGEPAAIQSQPNHNLFMEGINEPSSAEVIFFPRTKDEGELAATFTNHDLADVDAQGYPWDVRIHAAGKSKNSSGLWRSRRNAKPYYVAQIEAELRNKLASSAKLETLPVPELPPLPAILSEPAPLPPLQVAPPPPTVAAVPTQMPPAGQYFTSSNPVDTAVLPLAAPVPPQAVRPTGRSFDELMALVTDVLVGEMLQEEDVLRVIRNHDIKELADLNTAAPEMVATVYNAIEAAAK